MFADEVTCELVIGAISDDKLHLVGRSQGIKVGKTEAVAFSRSRALYINYLVDGFRHRLQRTFAAGFDQHLIALGEELAHERHDLALASVTAPTAEIFFWIAITFSQTLGTALGDWVSDGFDLGSATGALVFAAGLALVAALYFWTSVSRVSLFWAALILARPLGATLGDFLDQPHDQGGLALSRPLASAIIVIFIIVCLFVLPQSAAARAERST